MDVFHQPTKNMNIVGLITEYNPFHNGHLHHLRESLRVTGAEGSVAVMSGHFLQRGEAALVDKWVRTEMALEAGVDVVLELPFPWACNSAPHFAEGAVRTLEALGVVTDLCFGSETGEMGPLERCARFLKEWETELARGTEDLLREGVSYPAARARLVGERAGAEKELLRTPNNILGIEYLLALLRTGSSLAPHTILRRGPGYHEVGTAGEIASATGIRRRLASGEPIAPFVPGEALSHLERALDSGRSLDPKRLYQILTARIFADPGRLTDIHLAGHGLESRLLQGAETSSNFEELVSFIKARHFTRTRVQRLLCYLLLDLKGEEMDSFLRAGPLYIRLLGVSERGKKVLAASRKKRSLPVVGNLSRVYPTFRRFYGIGSAPRRLAERLLEVDLRATRIYTLLMKNWTGGSRNRDFFEPVRGKAGIQRETN